MSEEEDEEDEKEENERKDEEEEVLRLLLLLLLMLLLKHIRYISSYKVPIVPERAFIALAFHYSLSACYS